MLKDPIATVTLTAASHNQVKETFDFEDAVRMVHGGQSLERATKLLLGTLRRQERLWLLDGDLAFWSGLRGILFDRYNRKAFVMGAVPRLKIPGICFTDGPRGVVMDSSTCFPVSMARGATWNTSLEERIGHAIGLEGRAQGANYFGGICINLPRHPAWGRIQETYGEDPILLGEFGVALHHGVKENLMTCVKHYALNSMENARFIVDVQVDDGALHEVYLPHFRQLVEAGVSSVMSSYNSVRGEFVGENAELLTEILRHEWGFDGFVLSDFVFGLRDAARSVKAGLDIEAPFRQQRAQHLSQAMERGELAWSDVDRSCMRILRKQIEHTARIGHEDVDSSIVFCREHRDLAREAAAQGIVLLKNNEVSKTPLLPLDVSKLRSLAVIGRLSNRKNTGDNGSSAVFAPQVVTIYEGIKSALPATEIVLEDNDNVDDARKVAASAETVICVVGYDAADEGEYVVPSLKDQTELLDLLPPTMNATDAEVRAAIEGQKSTGFGSGDAEADALVPGSGGDRNSLKLRQQDLEIIKAASSVSKRVIVAVIAAGAVIMEDWIDLVPSLLMLWYGGGEGGHAFADVLLGRVDASGRMPFSVPRSEEHLPHFDINAKKIVYDRWFGQRLLEKLEVEPRFPLGYGLSYTSFTLSELTVDTSSLAQGLEYFKITTKVTNTGFRPGRHVVQVYGTLDAPDFPKRVLLGFSSIAVGSDRTETVIVRCSTRPLQRRVDGRFVPAAREVGIEVAAYASQKDCLKTSISVL